MTTVLSWNVAGRVARLDEQTDRVIALVADVVCLQEVSARTGPIWRTRLAQAGWEHVAIAEPTILEPHVAPKRRLAVLIAARAPLSIAEVPQIPWTERVLAAVIDGVEYVNVHSPISPSPDLAKVRTHEAVHEYLAAGSGPRVLCGDLNTPRREQPDGRVWTFARTRYGALRPDRGERWDLAELALIKGLEPCGFHDAFREHHDASEREISWGWARWPGGYRLDHLIVSAEVRVDEVSYLHEWRTTGLSDHSPLFARLRLNLTEEAP